MSLLFQLEIKNVLKYHWESTNPIQTVNFLPSRTCYAKKQIKFKAFISLFWDNLVALFSLSVIYVTLRNQPHLRKVKYYCFFYGNKNMLLF